MDEKLLYDTFSAFGVIVTNPKVTFLAFLLLASEVKLFSFLVKLPRNVLRLYGNYLLANTDVGVLILKLNRMLFMIFQQLRVSIRSFMHIIYSFVRHETVICYLCMPMHRGCVFLAVCNNFAYHFCNCSLSLIFF